MIKEHRMQPVINCLRISFNPCLKKLSLIFAMMLACITIFAQRNNSAGIYVKGSVSSESGPVANAAVLLQLSTDSSLVQGTLTDTSGSFTFHSIQQGNYYISVQSLGYEFFTSQIF